jgi:hypothetical protein
VVSRGFVMVETSMVLISRRACDETEGAEVRAVWYGGRYSIISSAFDGDQRDNRGIHVEHRV